MKLICFHLFNDYSGSPKVLKNTLQHLLAEGVEVVLVTSRGGMLDELEGCGNIRFRRYSYRFSKNAVLTMLRYVWAQIYTFFLALGYICDKEVVFYINTILPAGPALAGWLTGKRVIYHYHENATVKSRFYRVLAWVMQRLASEIICVSRYQRSFLKRQKGVSVVPNAIDDAFIARLTPNPQKAFEQRRVLMLGSLKKYKGTIEFCTLAKVLPQYNFELVINDTQENIDAFWRDNNIGKPENLIVHPRQEDVAPFYNRASIVLNLSNKELFIETFGLTVLEAMSAGLPVIVPTVGGVAEMVDDGKNGFKINIQDLSFIAEKIEKLLTNRELFLSLCEEGLARSKKYNSAATAYEILYKIRDKGNL